VLRSTCHYGCLPEDIESGGMEAVCPDCARKWGEGLPLAAPDRVRLIELPLNARLEDVIGGLNESGPHERGRLRRGLLAQADRNLLYIDEVNLLPDELIDAILDAAAQGQYTLRRGGVTAVLRSRLMLIGSMNPEEGRLRPQIQDRFGLRVVLDGLTDLEERLEAYRRVQAYLTQPRSVVARFAPETDAVRAEIGTARRLLPSVTIPEPTARIGLQWIARLGIASLRAEISLFEAARAYAAADGRTEVLPADLSAVACMALRARRSTFMTDYAAAQAVEAQEIRALFASEEAPHD
jgi:magnesium chelatase subunit I